LITLRVGARRKLWKRRERVPEPLEVLIEHLTTVPNRRLADIMTDDIEDLDNTRQLLMRWRPETD
jgi:hypothetical protein